MDHLVLPSPLHNAKRVLLAGAGGGFDVFASLPLHAALRAAGKEVFLANLSFTYLGGTDAIPRFGAYPIDHLTVGPKNYFPEKLLAEFLHQQQLSSLIYAFEKTGVRPLQQAYQSLIDAHEFDAIVLVDGGTDILMRGDEAGLGTPEEDMTSLAAVASLSVPTKLVVCIGFGIDAFHGVCHAHFLENVAALSMQGAFLGAQAVLPQMPEGAFYRSAVAHAETRMPDYISIVNSSIDAAIEGRFGNYHRTERTKKSELFINPLMTFLWTFDLDAVAKHSLYLPLLANTESIWDVAALIEAFRKTISRRPRQPIPH